MYHMKISSLLANKEFEAEEFREKKTHRCVIEVEILKKIFLKKQ